MGDDNAASSAIESAKVREGVSLAPAAQEGTVGQRIRGVTCPEIRNDNATDRVVCLRTRHSAASSARVDRIWLPFRTSKWAEGHRFSGHPRRTVPQREPVPVPIERSGRTGDGVPQGILWRHSDRADRGYLFH